MSFLLNLKTHSFKGALVILCCWCSFQVNAQDDPADLDKFAYKIPSADSTFIQKALKSIPNATYVYLAVCSTYGDEFRIWDSESQKPKSVKAVNLAKWIDEATTQKLISADKDIVLITCAKASVSQVLVNALGMRDKAAKRTIRKIIGWEDEMLLYANGHIQGYGKCQQFSATPKGVTAVPIELTGEKIPQGNPTVSGTFVVLTTTQNILSSWLSSCQPDSLRFQLQAATHEYKANSLEAYNYLVANKTCFEGWKYLKQILAKSPLCVNTSFLCSIAKVKTLYLDKPDTGDIQKQYQRYFERFIKMGGTKRESDIKSLEKAGIDITDFEALVDEAVSEQAVTDLFEQGTTITGSLDQQLTVLATSEPKLSAELNTTHSTLPEQLWKDLRDTLKISRIKGIATLKDARGRLTDPINIAIGKYLNLKTIRDITSSKTGFITQEGNWGAIFESWVETNILNAKNKKANLGKWTFYFENGEWKDKFSDKSLPKRTIDCSFDDAGKVGVEIKHIQAGFNKKQQEQLDVNAVLSETKKIKRIEYIFSKEAAAKLNEIYFLAKFYPAPNKTIPFKVYYIDANGNLQPFIITKK